MEDPVEGVRPEIPSPRGSSRQDRREKSLWVELIKVALGGAAGLVLAYFLLLYAFGIDVLDNLAPRPPAGLQSAATDEGVLHDRASTNSAAQPHDAAAPAVGNIDDNQTDDDASPSNSSAPHEVTSEIVAPLAPDPFARGEIDLGPGEASKADTRDKPANSTGMAQEGTSEGQSETAKPVVNKLPVPSPEIQAPVAERVKDIFRADYAAATTPELRAKLATQLQSEAPTLQEDSVARFIMLREAYELAVSAGNYELADSTARAIDESFQVDLSGIFVHLLTSLARSADTNDARRDIATKCLALAPSLKDSQRFEEALILISTAEALATRVRDAELQTQATQLNVESRLAQQAWKEVQAAQEVLKESPDEAEPNLVVGRYWCCVKLDWAQGLPLLAKGADPLLATAAKLDLAGAATAIERMNIADAWYTAGASGNGGDAFLARAHFWYHEAVSELTGLDRVKADKRLGELARFANNPPGDQGGIAAIDPLDTIEAQEKQAAWAKKLSIPKIETNSIGMTLALIPPGEFTMGSPLSERTRANDEQSHRVKISKPFYLGTTEVTQRQYEIVMGVNPSKFSRMGSQSGNVRGIDSAHLPVDSVSWQNAVEFCTKLSALTSEKEVRRTYRLPTEAEWEYACRAGTNTTFGFGGEWEQLDDYAWYGDNSGRAPYDAFDFFDKLPFDDYWTKILANGGRPHEVATKLPNAWGLFDMHGNVWEHCEDSYVLFDPSVESVDSVARTGSRERVCRGGSWFFPADQCRAAKRRKQNPVDKYNDCGFRVVCEIAQ